jgi:hypothetical protein
LSTTTRTDEEYFDALLRHDWFYENSDDYQKVLAGERVRCALVDEMQASPGIEKTKMYFAWKDYQFSGPMFGTPKKIQPELKDFV